MSMPSSSGSAFPAVPPIVGGAKGPRVLHVITPSRMAGAETFLTRLLRRAEGSAAEHHCVASAGSPALAEMRFAGVEPTPLGISGKVNLLATRRLRQAARRTGAELLHSHLSSASWWCGWLERMGGPPSIGHVHGCTSALWHRGQSRLIACSEAVKQDLIAKGIDAERICVMHYPVDPNDLVPTRLPARIREELGATAKTPTVGTFAHLSLKKGYRELVQAARLVCDRIPQAQFWCFGEGPLRGELESTARALGIADRFRLLGFRRGVGDWMRAVDVMALPSHREPFGLVYVEAGLCERPVVACRAGGAPEIIEDGVNGRLVPPQDPAALADALTELLDDRARAAAMGKRGREMALERFAWPAYLRQLDELYREVAGRK
jgi:glycosyltransferase involved in cell wall biosynthesis